MTPAGLLEGLRLLVVEDEYFIALDTAEKLACEGAVVIGPAATVEDALKLLEEGRAPDAGVLDLNLSGETAYAVADALTQRGIPFVFATGQGGADASPLYAAVPRCKKPIDAATVASLLRK